MAQIKGKVARIIDESTVIITVGQQHGVTSGMRFVIYEEGEEVLDPDTDQPLGAWEVVKGEVAAKHVQERITIAQVPPRQTKPPDGTVSALMAEVSKGRTAEMGSLNVNRSDLSGRPQVGRPVHRQHLGEGQRVAQAVADLGRRMAHAVGEEAAPEGHAADVDLGVAGVAVIGGVV